MCWTQERRTEQIPVILPASFCNESKFCHYHFYNSLDQNWIQTVLVWKCGQLKVKYQTDTTEEMPRLMTTLMINLNHKFLFNNSYIQIETGVPKVTTIVANFVYKMLNYMGTSGVRGRQCEGTNQNWKFNGWISMNFAMNMIVTLYLRALILFAFTYNFWVTHLYLCTLWGMISMVCMYCIRHTCLWSSVRPLK